MPDSTVPSFTPATPAAPAGVVGAFTPSAPTAPLATVPPFAGIIPNAPAPVQQAIPQGQAVWATPLPTGLAAFEYITILDDKLFINFGGETYFILANKQPTTISPP